MLFRKVMSFAFGFGVERRDDDKRCKAWHEIVVKLDWLRAVQAAYSPRCLAKDDGRGALPDFEGAVFRRARVFIEVLTK